MHCLEYVLISRNRANGAVRRPDSVILRAVRICRRGQNPMEPRRTRHTLLWSEPLQC